MTYLFVAWLASFPFIILWGAYEGPKIIWLWAGGFLLAVYWIVRIIRRGQFPIRPEDRWYVLWLCALFTASIIGVHPIDSIVGGSYRHQGVLFFLTLYLIAVSVRQIGKEFRARLGLILALGVVAESLLIMIQKISSWATRPSGTFGEPNAAAGYLVFGLFWLWKSAYLSRTVRIAGSLLIYIAVIATGSRIGIIIAFFVLVCSAGLPVSRIAHMRVILITVLLGGLMVIGLNRYVEKKAFDIVHGQTDYENRIVYLRYGFEEFRSRPFFGFGAESGEYIYNRAFLKRSVRLEDFMVDRSHNLFLDIALWSGLFGLCAFMLWLAVVSQRLFAQHESDRLWFTAAWVLFACIQPVGVAHWIQFVILTTHVGPEDRLSQNARRGSGRSNATY